MTVAIVLLAFAANSFLCRWALDVHQFDPALFTLLRLASGAFMLSLLVRWFPLKADSQSIFSASIASAPDGRILAWPNLNEWRSGKLWLSGFGLATYAMGFSWAYLQLDTGVGAFILFATVQLAMQAIAFAQGTRLSVGQWLGNGISLSGLALLLLPGQHAPDALSAALMIIAALGWALFVYFGQQSSKPLVDVQRAFISAAVIMLLLFLPLFDEWLHWNWRPWVLALVSGMLASGVGYFLWYRVLPGLGMNKAAQLQLLVPVIAMLMGVLLLAERVTDIMLLAMAIIVGGILLAIRSRKT